MWDFLDVIFVLVERVRVIFVITIGSKLDGIHEFFYFAKSIKNHKKAKTERMENKMKENINFFNLGISCW